MSILYILVTNIYLSTALPFPFIFTQQNKIVNQNTNRPVTPAACIDHAVLKLRVEQASEYAFLSRCEKKWQIFDKNRRPIAPSSLAAQSKNTFFVLEQGAQLVAAIDHKKNQQLAIFEAKKSQLIRHARVNLSPERSARALFSFKKNWYLLTEKSLQKITPFSLVHNNDWANYYIMRLGHFQLVENQRLLLMTFKRPALAVAAYDLTEKKWLTVPPAVLSEDLRRAFKQNNVVLNLSQATSLSERRQYFEVLVNQKKRAQSPYHSPGEEVLLPLKMKNGRQLLKCIRFLARSPGKYSKDKNINQLNGISLDIKRNKLYYLVLRKGALTDEKPFKLQILIFDRSLLKQ